MLSCLPNLKKSEKGIDCEFFKTPTQAFKIVKKGIPATTAGDRGAITFYIDDNGKYHCLYMVYCDTKENVWFNYKKDAVIWLKYHLEKIK